MQEVPLSGLGVRDCHNRDRTASADKAHGLARRRGVIEPMAIEMSTTNPADDGSVGVVETQTVTLFEPPATLTLAGGGRLGPVTVAYETYGTLSPERDNAIFICHALTGDAHAAGVHDSSDEKPGWWDDFVGPGKGLDTDRYYVICANVLGGCQGTTGPGTTSSDGDGPWGLRFPFLTVDDIVRVHAGLVEHLGISRLLAVIGGSLGGMQVLEWAARFPDRLRSAIVLASGAKLAARGIAFNAIGRRAILVDPGFNDGNYYDQDEGPRFGLALARMVAHITYLSEDSIELKFGRRLQQGDSFAYDLTRETEFQVESYLHYQGKRFVERFDANSYLFLTRAMDYFDLASTHGSLTRAFAQTEARFLVTSYSTDWLFPASQGREVVRTLLDVGRDVTFVEFDSVYGHDAFLIEHAQLAGVVVPFLEQTFARGTNVP
jgi:homoserine O-acetyltransferase